MSTQIHARALYCIYRRSSMIMGQCRQGLLTYRKKSTLFVLLSLPAVHTWHYATGLWVSGSRRPKSSSMQTGSADIMDVERLWPALAGKQTCANDAAGKVIHYWWVVRQYHGYRLHRGVKSCRACRGVFFEFKVQNWLPGCYGHPTSLTSTTVVGKQTCTNGAVPMMQLAINPLLVCRNKAS